MNLNDPKFSMETAYNIYKDQYKLTGEEMKEKEHVENVIRIFQSILKALSTTPRGISPGSIEKFSKPTHKQAAKSGDEVSEEVERLKGEEFGDLTAEDKLVILYGEKEGGHFIIDVHDNWLMAKGFITENQAAKVEKIYDKKYLDQSEKT